MISITIPESVTAIGGSAFENCNALIAVQVNKQQPIYLENYTFSNRANATLYVPTGSKTAYEAANYWKDFKEIVEVDFNNSMTLPNLTVIRGGQATLTVGMENENRITAFQFDMELPEGVSIATDAKGNYIANLTDRKADHTLSLTKTDDTHYRFVAISMTNKEFSGSEGAVMTIKLNAEDSLENGDYQITITNTELTSVEDGDIATIDSMDTSATLTVKDAELGDVNGDMKITVTDVASIVGYILNDRPTVFIEKAADVNGDSKISVTDAVLVIDMILNDGSNASNIRRKEQTEVEPQ